MIWPLFTFFQNQCKDSGFKYIRYSYDNKRFEASYDGKSYVEIWILRTKDKKALEEIENE